MSTVTFDTHKAITDLEKAGMPKGQAEAIAAVFKEAQAGTGLVTKKDLELSSLALRADMQKELLALRADMQRELEPIRSDIRMLKWMASVNVAGTLALIGLVTSLFMKLVR